MERRAEILALAKRLGHTAQEDDEALELLCAQAERELLGRLHKDVTVADCESAFVLAAAWLALAGLCGAQAAEEGADFTAGSLTIRQSGKSPMERSAGLRRQAEQIMGPYLADRGFVFRGVAG